MNIACYVEATITFKMVSPRKTLAFLDSQNFPIKCYMYLRQHAISFFNHPPPYPHLPPKKDQFLFHTNALFSIK